MLLRFAQTRGRRRPRLHNPLDLAFSFVAIWRLTTCRRLLYMETLPLTEPVLLILLSLAGQAQHGYAILKDVEAMSNGRVVLSTGTLYGALRRLLDDDWIERFEEEESPRGRQAYRLTPQGRRNLQLEIQRMKHITRLATLRVARQER
jgi:DNA-binding PadR family transcriptional regulator